MNMLQEQKREGALSLIFCKEVYEAPAAMEAELREREAELRDVTSVMARDDSPDQKLREHRDHLISEVRRLERLIAEAERVLGPPQTDEEGEPDLAHAA